MSDSIDIHAVPFSLCAAFESKRDSTEVREGSLRPGIGVAKE
jgi:hypothetical protein